MLAQATLLVHLKPNSSTNVMTNASEMVVGAVLQQHIAGEWQPIAYFSKKLKPAETRYSAFDRELLALYLAIKHFRHFLEGRPFQVLTDHKPLTYVVSSQPENHTPRPIRHLDYISRFTSDIQYIKGEDNTAADTLSRISTIAGSIPTKVDFEAMAKAQQNDSEIRQLQLSPLSSSLVCQSVPIPTSNATKSSGVPCRIVPQSFRRRVFDA